MDNLPKSAGHISEVTVERERVKLTPGKSDDDYRLTLTRLRRLSQIVMSRTVRRRFEARKLYRSNIIKYLEKNLMNSSKKVRYLALQLLYSTIPRLGNKTDSLLEPLLPKIFQCLQEIEGKDMNLLAIHFLRGYFRHTKTPTRFIENYVRLGIENSDHHIQISCCFSLNIIFDQDIQNSIFTQIVVPVMNLLMQGNHYQLTRVVYHSLKQIQNVVGEDRFFIITSNADPKAIEMYSKSCIFEESNSSLTFNDNNYNTLVSEYRVKRKASNAKKDFGIFDPTLLDRIQKTSHCKRAGAMSNFAIALKQTSWKQEDLLPHMMDFLKFINASVTDTNRLVQVSGLKILEELINIMGFILSPHIHWIVEILLQELTSANIKVRSMGRRVLHKLMRNVHPMTVTWELLRTENDSLKIVALIVSQDALSNFLYHEIDLINLCNYLGKSVEHENPDLANCSRDFIVSLLDVMRECPVYGIRKEAVRILLESNTLQEDTLRDIGVFKYSKKEEFQEGFEFQSSSDDETTDYDTSNNPPGTASTGISMAMSQSSISTAGEYEAVYRDSYLGFIEENKSVQRSTLNSNCKSTNSESIEETWKQLENGSNTELHSPENIRSPIEGQNDVTQATGKNSLVESSETSSIKESILFSETDSISSRSFSRAFEENIPQLGDSKQKRNDSVITPKSLESSQAWKKIEKSSLDTSSNFKRTHSTSIRDDASPCKELTQTKKVNNATTQNSKVLASKNIYGLLKPNSRYKSKKYATPFSVKKDIKRSADSERHSSQDIHAAGDAESISETSLLNLQEEPEIEINPRYILESYEQDGIQVDVIDKNVYNFNIMQVEYHQSNETISEPEDVKTVEIKTHKAKDSLNRKMKTSRQMDKCNITEKVKKLHNLDGRDSKIFKIRNGKASSGNSLNDRKLQRKTCSQRFTDTDLCKQNQNDIETSPNILIDDKELNLKSSGVQKLFVDEEVSCAHMDVPVEKDCDFIDIPEEIDGEIVDSYLEKSNDFIDNPEESLIIDQPSRNSIREVKSSAEISVSSSNDFEKVKMPFLPKSRQLPRTPVRTKAEISLEGEANLKKSKESDIPKKKIKIKKIVETKEVSSIGSNNQCEESERSFRKSIDKTTPLNGTETKTCNTGKHSSPLKWAGCQWKRDLEYASKAGTCPWAENFEKEVRNMKPFQPNEVDNEMRKALEYLEGKSWKKKEEAMMRVLRVAKNHPELIQENTSKIVFVLSNEIRNIRQSVAGKAILTTGHLYEIMGRNFESNIRLAVGALLAKSGNRTLAAYFRLVIKSLFKITNSTSPQKIVMTFILQGSKLSNKYARETAAQFIAILTERLGPENSLTSSLSCPMLKCAASFVTDSSALTRYCGKRMFKVFMKHREFEKLKYNHLDINTLNFIANILVQIKEKGITEEILPINVID